MLNKIVHSKFPPFRLTACMHATVFWSYFLIVSGAYWSAFYPSVGFLAALLVAATPIFIPSYYYVWRAVAGVSSIFYGLRVFELSWTAWRVRQSKYRSLSNSHNISTKVGGRTSGLKYVDDGITQIAEDARLLGIQPGNTLRRVLAPFLYFHARDLCDCRWKSNDKHERHSIRSEFLAILPTGVGLGLLLFFCTNVLTLLHHAKRVQQGRLDLQDLPTVCPTLPWFHECHNIFQATLFFFLEYPWLLRFVRYICCAIFLYSFLDAIDLTMKMGIMPLLVHIPLQHRVQLQPILARSLSEFWSLRWNRIIQEQVLKKYIFTPSVQLLSATKIAPCSAKSIAAMVTFIMSGLWHALPIWYAFGTIPHVPLSIFEYRHPDIFDLNGDGSTLDESIRGQTLGMMAFLFFVFQMLGIMVERQLVVKSWSSSIARRIWTLSFIAFTLPLIMEPVFQLAGL